MTVPQIDYRPPERRARDEAIAAEPPGPMPTLPADAAPLPVEAHLRRSRRPEAVAGVVENGLVRLLDPSIRLPEHTKVIVVATEAA